MKKILIFTSFLLYISDGSKILFTLYKSVIDACFPERKVYGCNICLVPPETAQNNQPRQSELCRFLSFCIVVYYISTAGRLQQCNLLLLVLQATVIFLIKQRHFLIEYYQMHTCFDFLDDLMCKRDIDRCRLKKKILIFLMLEIKICIV